ncbi:unnamed protein product [Amoebophrya sp. A120]|nr:unnamed protein product [Amoebophrya sp. A120]|eukprot:GSA120T00004596001.1
MRFSQRSPVALSTLRRNVLKRCLFPRLRSMIMLCLSCFAAGALGQRGETRNNVQQDPRVPPAQPHFLGDLSAAEPGLILAGSRTQSLNESDGILSFLNAADAALFLQSSRSHSQKDPSGAGAKLATAVREQHDKDTSLARRTENCEELFLEVLREKVGEKRPADYWNAELDGGYDYVKYFQTQVQRKPTQTGNQQQLPPSEMKWTVLFLMAMAAKTCDPPSALAETILPNHHPWGYADTYSAEKLRRGCQKSDQAFFREVLNFFHEDAPAKGACKYRKSSSSCKQVTGGRLVVWNPPGTVLTKGRVLGWGRTLPIRIARSRHYEKFDSRCRLAMAAELLFQKHSKIYGSRGPYHAKHGYCLNHEYILDAAHPNDIESYYHFEDPIDRNWHPLFRRMFRKFADKWRRQSDGTSPLWSYNQFQYEWRRAHGERPGSPGFPEMPSPAWLAKKFLIAYAAPATQRRKSFTSWSSAKVGSWN